MSQTGVPEYYDRVANVAVLIEKIRLKINDNYVDKPANFPMAFTLEHVESLLTEVAQALFILPEIEGE